MAKILTLAPMESQFSAFLTAVRLIVSLDAGLFEIILLSLKINLSALVISSAIGLPVGILLSIKSNWPGHSLCIGCLNSFMGLPPVVVGLMVYLLLSRTGPFGVLGLIFSPTAMIIAQVFLIFPIIASLSHRAVSSLHEDYRETLTSLGATPFSIGETLAWEARLSLLTCVLAGFGRASSEVGAVLIVGGNIEGATRVMTTAIALESGKGNLSRALALGLILIVLSLLINLVAQWFAYLSSRDHY